MARLVEYEVFLTDKEKNHLKKNTSAGKWDVRKVKRAHILLKADKSENASFSEEQIAHEIGCCISTVRNIKLRFAKGERLQVLEDKPRSGRPKLVDGELEAHIIATACSTPPEGRERWTVRLIAERMISLTAVETCSAATVGRALKKMNLNLGSKSSGKFLPEPVVNLFGEWKPY